MYDYSKTIYISDRDNLTIICEIHGEFDQKPTVHLRGGGCPKCGIEKNSKSRTYTNEEFIKKAIDIHGNKYNYTNVVYKKSDDYVDVICDNHGMFKIKANNHLQGNGCSKCANEQTGLLQRKSQDDFIKEVKQIHGDKYDYSKVVYETCKDKIIIICKVHGEFEQTPSQHFKGAGCNKCAIYKNSEKRKFTKEQFIKKAIDVHDNKYDYSKVNYVNSQTKVCIGCPKHEKEFMQQPNSHLQGMGCYECGIDKIKETQRFTTEYIIQKCKEVYGDNYDYTDTIYVNDMTKLKIKCPNGHIFEMKSYDHIYLKYGCNICSNHYVDRDIFIKKAKDVYGDKYDYSKVNYINSQTKIIIICKEHGEFPQQPNNHLLGNECPKCFRQYSKIQIDWLNTLESQLNLIIEHAENIGEHKILDSTLKADGYCKKINTIFEFDGCFYHGCPTCFPNRTDVNGIIKKSYQNLYDKTMNKKIYCVGKGYNYIQIWECQWKKIKKSKESMVLYLEQISNTIHGFNKHDTIIVTKKKTKYKKSCPMDYYDYM